MAGTPISQHEYLVTVGQILHNAARTDLSLLGAFIILTASDFELAKVIFFSIDAFQGRTSLLKRIVEAYGDADDTKLVKDILEAAGKSNKQRQQVSHAILQLTNPGTSDLSIVRPKSNSKVTVTKEYMQTLIQNSKDAHDAAWAALQTLREKHQGHKTPNSG